MKKLIITFISIFLLLSNTKAIELPGYFVDKTGEKVDVSFKIPTKLLTGELQLITVLRSVKIVHKGNTIKLTPDMCEKIVFHNNNIKYVFLSKPNRCLPVDSENIFLRPKKIDFVSIYYYLYYSSSSTMGANGIMYTSKSIEKGWVLENEKGQFLKVTYGGARRKDLAMLFSDYKEFADKITNKEIGSEDIKNTEKMVKYYNDWKRMQPITQTINLNSHQQDSLLKTIYYSNSDSTVDKYLNRILGYKVYSMFFDIKIDKDKHENGVIKSVGLISSNYASQKSQLDFVKIGTWHNYYENGNIKEIIQYNLKGQRHGYYYRYKKNGNLTATKRYYEGMQE